jgi:hypothetical protein
MWLKSLYVPDIEIKALAMNRAPPSLPLKAKQKGFEQDRFFRRRNTKPAPNRSFIAR